MVIYMKSVWTETIVMPSFKTLAEDIKTDVLIIGGGITGLLCAYILHKAGINYILVEASQICSGITMNTTAKITVQHGLIYNKLVKEFGVEKASLYLHANQDALKKYSDICKDIQCHFEQKDSYVYSINDHNKLDAELKAIERIGGTAEYSNKLSLPFITQGAVMFRDQAQFNPLQFAAAISKELNIYEYTKVKELGIKQAVTEHGTIHAEKIIIATHFPILNKHGLYFIKLYQSRSYVLTLQNAAELNGMYKDANDKGLSFRNYNNMLLLGGGGHRTGKDGGNWSELRNAAKKYYPNSSEIYHQATQDCMTVDNVPYIGRYCSKTEGLYVATGYNKWGMTSSMVSAMLLCDIIQGKKNEYEQVFTPKRSIVRKQTFINAGEAICNLASFKRKRCPHLGCALKWNKDEHSWDCPCHGSRFTSDGQLIDNPATDDL